MKIVLTKTGITELFAISSATCGVGSSHEVPTLLRATNGLPSSIPWIVAGHLGGSCRPEVHMSIRYDTVPDCHNRSSVLFWLMRNSTCFRMLQVTTPVNLHLSVLHMSISLAVWNCQVQILHLVVL